MRPHLSVYLGLSIDGCLAQHDGTLDFLAPYQQGDEDYGYAAFMATVDAVVMGRTTFEVVMGFGGAWPFGERRVVVLTHRPLPPDAPAHVTTHAGALKPLLTSLHADGVRHVYLDGGQAVRQGLADDVVDSLALSVVPEIVGHGRRLFDDTVPRSGWQLTNATPYASGLVQLRWTRVRASV